ncbi:MAG: PilZ domain-containing protein [PVC group bacterium]|nr:PilZ domain-containing protein [PVC group bacterium]
MEERRSARRYPVSLPARAIIAETQEACEGVVTDISFAGVRFVYDKQIDENQQLDITFSIDEQNITLKAVVACLGCLENAEKIQHGLKITGVAFDGDRKLLESFFQKREVE